MLFLESGMECNHEEKWIPYKVASWAILDLCGASRYNILPLGGSLFVRRVKSGDFLPSDGIIESVFI